MVDVFDKAKRSEVMAAVGSKDTKPEMMVRKALHKIGYRYRLHDRSLPGTPDLTFRKYNAVIMVNGCFWHGHDCALFRMPASNREFWRDKIENNRRRDKRAISQLTESGWRVLTIWECSLRGGRKSRFDELISAVEDWLQSDNGELELGAAYFNPPRRKDS